ncbi:MAG: three-Cys-motif partner protein TcmP [Actinomycetota bacterium]
MRWKEVPLFEIPGGEARKKAKRKELPGARLWTGNKARLIAEYLYRFVLVTKHGTYIDGFAGPQDLRHPEVCAARLVIERKHQPPWIRHYHLFELNPRSVDALDALRAEKAHPEREIIVYQGDFNNRVREILRPDMIDDAEATFALLDQRTFECHWRTVELLANYRRVERAYKIELFYFLADWWLGRAAGGSRPPRLAAWWGGPGSYEIVRMRSPQRADIMTRRFVDELGYTFVNPYAIYERRGGGRLVYYMIHATDHPDAPRLMDEAYRDAVLPHNAPEEITLF